MDGFNAAQAGQAQVEQHQSKLLRGLGLLKSLRGRARHPQFVGGKSVAQHLQQRVAVKWMIVDHKNGARQNMSP